MNNINNKLDIDNLKKQSIQGVFNSGIGAILPRFISLISTPIIARLIAPEYFGLIAMVAVILNFAKIFKDLGLSQSIIQKTNLSDSQSSTIFWIIIFINFILLFILLLITPLISSFYNEPRLINIMIFLSLNIFISGLSIYPHTILKRELKFRVISKIRVISSICSSVVGVIFAFLNYNYWALILMHVSGTLVSTILLWHESRFIPNKFDFSQEVKGMMNFGKYISGFNFINYFSRNMDNLLIGKIYGTVSLGLYSKAYQLLMLPIELIRGPIMDVALPALSKLKNNDKRYNSYYEKIIFTMAFFSMPLASILFLFSYNLILFFLGSNWVGATNIFVVLSVVAFIQPTLSAARGLPMISVGFSKRYFKFGLFQSCITVLGMYLGSKISLLSIPIGYVISYYLIIIPSIPYCLKNTGVKVKSFYYSIFHPFLASIIMIISIKVYLMYRHDNIFLFENISLGYIELILLIILSSFIYISYFLLSSFGRKYIFYLLSNLKLIFAR